MKIMNKKSTPLIIGLLFFLFSILTTIAAPPVLAAFCDKYSGTKKMACETGYSTSVD